MLKKLIKLKANYSLFKQKLDIESLQKQYHSQVFDVAIIGGGTAGLGFAIEAKKLGLNIALLDYVVPSPRGNSWGLGGTCVNVGCIPKKLMHHAALHGETMMASRPFGWEFQLNKDPNDNTQLYSKFNWESLVKNVQNHIKAQNFGYRSQLAQDQTTYINALAKFKDSNTLQFTDDVDDFYNDKNLAELKFKYGIVCTGGRPSMLECLKDVAITSDDIFSMQKPPGKTLVVGGGYIAVETAGFLAGFGYPVTMMTRNKYLKDFDQQVSDELLDHLQTYQKINVVPKSLPYKAQKLDNSKIKVFWRNQIDEEEGSDEFDTVLVAIGRDGNTDGLNLDKLGVKTKKKKILGGVNGEAEKTNGQNIYALGDVLHNIPELQPIAQKSAQLLAHRIKLMKENKMNSSEYQSMLMDYLDYPTTIFTPHEYSCVGLSEEQAIKRFGNDSIEVYHSKFTPLEESLCQKYDQNFQSLQKMNYCKVIFNKKDSNRVVGIHYVGPNAGEVMQGFSVAIKLGITMNQIRRAVGIHPTSAEEFTLLKVTKSSGEDYVKKGC